MKKMFAFLVFSTVLISQFTSYSQDGQLFKWKLPTPQGSTIRFVKMFDANTWFMAGSSGLFMKTTNGGSSFSFTQKAGFPYPIPGAFNSILDGHFFDQNNGILAGTSGITRTSDGGNTWSVVYTLANVNRQFNQVFFRNATNGYAVGTGGTFIKTTDAGLTWTSIPNVTFTSTIYDVFTPNDTLLVASSISGAIRTSTDAGNTWTSQTLAGSPAIYKLTFKDNLIGIAHGSSSKLFLTTDGGLTWTDKSAGLVAATTYYDSKFVGDTIYVTGNSFYILKSIDRGSTWSSVSFLDPTQPWTSTFYATDIFGSRLITGGGFGLLQKVDAGNSPSALTKVQKVGANFDIWKSPATQKIITVGAPSAAGIQDQIMISSDGGSNWTFGTTSITSNRLNSPTFVSDECQPPQLNNGLKYSPSTFSSATFRSISMIDESNGWIVGNNGAAYKTSNGGTSWDSVAVSGTNSSYDFYKVDFLNSSTGWIYTYTADETGTVLKTTDGGTTWSKYKLSNVFLDPNEHKILAQTRVNANLQWVTNYTPSIFKSTNAGQTWTQQFLSDGWNSGFLYDIKMIDSLRGWACGSTGKLYKTTNAGATWDNVNYLGTTSPAALFKIISTGPDNVTVAGSAGLILSSTDGGASWTWYNTALGNTNWSLAYDFPVGSNSNASFYVASAYGAIFTMERFNVPVDITSLSSDINGSIITLNWSTITETTNLSFEVERSKDKSNFIKIGFVNGKGTSLSPRSYFFVDRNLPQGIYKYRIKQIDLNGTFKYYDLTNSVEIGSPTICSLSQNYPNPFNPETMIDYTITEASHVKIVVYNSLGEQVAELVNQIQPPNFYEVKFNASSLSSGVYFYKLVAISTDGKSNFVNIRKMIFMK